MSNHKRAVMFEIDQACQTPDNDLKQVSATMAVAHALLAINYTLEELSNRLYGIERELGAIDLSIIDHS